MAYRLDKTGVQVRDDLNAVEEKTIYPDATITNDGIMTMEHVRRLGAAETDIEEIETAVLTETEIRMICI